MPLWIKNQWLAQFKYVIETLMQQDLNSPLAKAIKEGVPGGKSIDELLALLDKTL